MFHKDVSKFMYVSLSVAVIELVIGILLICCVTTPGFRTFALFVGIGLVLIPILWVLVYRVHLKARRIHATETPVTQRVRIRFHESDEHAKYTAELNCGKTLKTVNLFPPSWDVPLNMDFEDVAVFCDPKSGKPYVIDIEGKLLWVLYHI